MKENWGSSESWVSRVLSNAPRAANPFLTKLERVCLSHAYNSVFRHGAHLNHIRSYAALPSVKEISAPYAACFWSYKESHLAPLVSEVINLELLNVREYDIENLCSFLKGSSKLEAFKLSADGRSDFDDVESPPMIKASLIKDTLLATAKTTLRTLTILTFHEQYDSIGSLRDFEVLTELHNNWSLLVRRAYILQTVLPASLHHLKLEDEMDDGSDDYSNFVQEALCANRSGILHLETNHFDDARMEKA